MKYINKKTRREYELIARGYDVTGINHVRVCIYRSPFGEWFVREEKEFEMKFSPAPGGEEKEG